MDPEEHVHDISIEAKSPKYDLNIKSYSTGKSHLHHLLGSKTPNESIDRSQISPGSEGQFLDEVFIQLLQYAIPVQFPHHRDQHFCIFLQEVVKIVFETGASQSIVDSRHKIFTL